MARGQQGSGTSNRGFASMDPAKQRAIAAEGGRAAHAQGVAHEFDSNEAREAGRKGGQARSSRAAAAHARMADAQGSDATLSPSSDRDMQSQSRGQGSQGSQQSVGQGSQGQQGGSGSQRNS